MKRNLLIPRFAPLLLFNMLLWSATAVLSQSGPAAPAGSAGSSLGASTGTSAGKSVGSSAASPAQSTGPVSYASVTELNGMLAQLEASSKNTQADLVKLRIEHWKTSAASKKETLAKLDSIQRDLQGTLPDVISQLRAAPEDLPLTFKLYRNLDALCDVVGSVAEDTGAFGTKDELQMMANDLNGFDGTRKQLAQRMESLSAAKEAEIVRLRTALQAATPAAPPKKTVVDDNAPPAKKPVVKKKPVAKPTAPAGTPPPAATTPPATAPAKPQ